MLHGLRRTAGAGKKGMSIVSRMFTSKEGRTDSGGYIHVRLQHPASNMQHATWVDSGGRCIPHVIREDRLHMSTLSTMEYPEYHGVP